MPYDQFKQDNKQHLKFEFNGVEKLQRSYSQMHQDLFVLSILNGKENGTYLEIGSNHPVEVNNTYALENVYNWRGVSLDIDDTWIVNWNFHRKNTLVVENATTLDYDKLLTDLNLGTCIDYLSVDIDPPQGTFNALKKIPHDKYKFNVITFEHSANIPEGIPVREESRKFLFDLGYELIIPDVSNEELYGEEQGKLYPVEDWWVNKNNVDSSAFEKLKVDINNYIASRYTVYNKSYVWVGL